ncbi:MAG: matrixin family metalloprotease [Anaerolineales bacterium]|nr:matrixin family metalloprotease [Anaerolineales bacterium]
MRHPFLKHLVIIFILLSVVSIACTFSATAAEPETGYRYDNLPDAGDEDETVLKYRAISQWGKTNISYFFINGTGKLSGETERDLIRAAFNLWAGETPLTFNEAADAAQADILIGWAEGNHGDGDPFDGPGDVLAHASFPNPYNNRQVFLHFDDAERWVNSETQNVDLLTVAAHEIGHNLGLDHSNDPGALMFPSYSGPQRFLGRDDVAGVQSLYGLAAQPAQSPQAPPQGATPPPSANTDSDKDGISDEDEILRTGTDPQKKDTDGDGLSDGVEVYYRMNPLDPDMDKDGVSDGQEVALGSDPFFPDQTTNISPELSKEVSDFLTQAIQLQIEAYRQGDANIAASIMAGDIFAALQTEIASLNQQGLVQISEIDSYKSYIDDIRLIDNASIEVDTCEVWSTNLYRRSDGALIQSIDPRLLPQTIRIEKLNSGWFITKVDFFDAPAFCSQ